jgi:hypothetical protein
MAPIAKVSVSPDAVVLLAVRAAHHARRGTESQTSALVVVAAGISVKVTAPVVVTLPLASVPSAVVRFWRAYDPPATSVPAALALPVVVHRRNIMGVVGEVRSRDVIACVQVRRQRFAVRVVDAGVTGAGDDREAERATHARVAAVVEVGVFVRRQAAHHDMPW